MAQDTDRIAALAKKGLTGAEIAREIGCTRQAVYARLDKLGIARTRFTVDPASPQSRPGGTGGRGARRVEIDGAELLRLRGEGWTLASLGDHFRCSVAAIRTRLEAEARATRTAVRATRPPESSPPDGVGNIPAARVVALVATGGRYRALAELADRWRQPLGRVQAWYHRARAAA